MSAIAQPVSDRRRYQAAHCALREEIRSFVGIGAQRLQFVCGPHGKPSVAHGINCHFSMSYCGDIAAIALSCDTEIGVDLERIRPIEAVEQLAASHFAAEEAYALNACEVAGRDEAFLRGWVRKEACVKAVGYGLLQPTDSFVSGIGAGATVAVLPLAEREMRVAVSNLADAPDGHVAALAMVLRGR
jgi:4'-phosphopantetheinyl transferase